MFNKDERIRTLENQVDLLIDLAQTQDKKIKELQDWKEVIDKKLFPKTMGGRK